MVTIGGLQGVTPIPTQYKLIALLLTSLGIQDAEPGVIGLLSDFIRSYVSQILHASIPYVEHAARPPPDVIQADDIRLAISSFTAKLNTAPSREFLQSLATKVNSVPIGSMGEVFGARVPEARYRLNTNIGAGFGRNEGPIMEPSLNDIDLADMATFADSLLKEEEAMNLESKVEAQEDAAMEDDNAELTQDEDDLFGDADLDVEDDLELVPEEETQELVADAAPPPDVIQTANRTLDDDYD